MLATKALETGMAVVFSLPAIYLSYWDIKTRRLPNKVILPTLGIVFFLLVIKFSINLNLVGLILSVLIPLLVAALFLVAYYFYPNGLGMGDIKAILLVGLVTCHIDPSLFLFILMTAFVSSSVYGIFVQFGLKKREFKIPFGPFLFVPAIISLGIAQIY